MSGALIQFPTNKHDRRVAYRHRLIRVQTQRYIAALLILVAMSLISAEIYEAYRAAFWIILLTFIPILGIVATLYREGRL